MKRLLIAFSVVLALVLVGATFALAGGGGLIWDDGHAVKPGSLDDGKQFLPQTTITLGQAETVRDRLTHAGFESPVVQTFGTGNNISVRLKPRAGDHSLLALLAATSSR